HLSRSNALNSAARQVSNASSLARQYAITHRVSTELRITNSWDGVTVLTNGVQIDKWNFFPPGVIVDSNLTLDTTILFKPTGGTTNLTEARIVIREGSYAGNAMFGTNSNVATVTVNQVLGRVTVYQQ